MLLHAVNEFQGTEHHWCGYEKKFMLPTNNSIIFPYFYLHLHKTCTPAFFRELLHQ